jgi:hypothetical protein
MASGGAWTFLRGACALLAQSRAATCGMCALCLVVYTGCSSPASSAGDGGGAEDGAATDAGSDGAPSPDAGDFDAGEDGGACEVTPPELLEPEAPDLEQLCGSAPITFEDWEQCYLRRYCEWLMTCFDRVVYRDLSECMAWAEAASPRLAFERRERERAVAQGRAAVDQEAFTRCLQELGPSPCLRLAPQFRASCRRRLQGTVDDGGACFADVECASPGAGCVREEECAGACCEGECQAPLPEGATDCRLVYTSTDPAQVCEPGLQCVPGAPRCDDDVWCCVAGTDPGAPCTNHLDCRPGTWCDRECGVCRAPLPEGAVCTDRRQCGDRTECVGLSIIHADPGECIRVDEEGADCDLDCRGPLYCGPLLVDNSERSCHFMAELGETCPFGVAGCRGATNTCSGSECVPRTSDGEPCGSGLPACMPGSFCTSSLGAEDPVCASPQDDGSLCTHPFHCASYLCSGDAGAPGECLPWLETCP